MRSSNRLSILAALGFACAAAGAGATTIDFDDQVFGSVLNTQPGNRYAASGITFTSADVPAGFNAAISVGDTFVLTGLNNQFVIINNVNSVSPPNFAGADTLVQRDTLMSFSGPITTLSLHSDDTPGEVPDVIRLLALRATGNANEYEVLAIDEKLDNAVSEPGNLLSVSLAAGFSFALFQVTTEQEGFDDVKFDLPEPASSALMALGLAGLATLRRRRPPARA